jgi:dTDP-4-amino-4,6-dideoxygalactose transaminase
MHQQPLFKAALSLETGVSEKLFEQGLCLPSGTDMTQEDVRRVTEIIKGLSL